MDAVMAVKRGDAGAALPALRERRVKRQVDAARSLEPPSTSRPGPTSPTDQPGAHAAVLGRPDRQGGAAGGLRLLPRRAGDVHGPVGAEGVARGRGPSYEELVETEGRPRLRAWLDRIQTEGIMEPAVVYGYWPCFSDGDDLVVLDAEDQSDEIARFTFPRQHRDRFLCLSDFFRPQESGELDVIAFHLVTMGDRVSEVTGELFADERLPRLPRAARAVGAADRGAGGVLARPGPRRARIRRRGRRRHGRGLPAGLPGVPLLVRLSRPARTWRIAPRSSGCSGPSGSGSR